MNYQSNASQAPQGVDATICSIESTGDGLGSIVKTNQKPKGKVKAYVDFSDFNKNYEEYLKSKGRKEKDGEKEPTEASASNPSKTPEDWEILS